MSWVSKASIEIYTDGAYSQSRNKGGYSFIVMIDSKPSIKYHRSITDATNQVAEMMALIAAFNYIYNKDIRCSVFTDSMYCIGGLTMNWNKNANIKLWDKLTKAYNRVKNHIELKHVRGHHGILGNEIADMLAVIASEANG